MTQRTLRKENLPKNWDVEWTGTVDRTSDFGRKGLQFSPGQGHLLWAAFSKSHKFSKLGLKICMDGLTKPLFLGRPRPSKQLTSNRMLGQSV